MTQSVSLNVNGKAVDVQIDDPRLPVSAAISSAVFDAVGVRLRSVPFSPKNSSPP